MLKSMFMLDRCRNCFTRICVDSFDALYIHTGLAGNNMDAQGTNLGERLVLYPTHRVTSYGILL